MAERIDLDLLHQLGARRPDFASIVRDFVPPPRFSDKHFDNYHPDHPSQQAAFERLRILATRLAVSPGRRLFRRRSASSPAGVYLDGGFGVGKTHLLAALWKEGREPKAFLSFDELMYVIGLAGVDQAVAGFRSHRVVAVDEWELDDPGNLKMALAFLRGIIAEGAFVAVTSNTLPLDLGSGRFSQKDFQAEIEELSSRFELVRIQGEDYRHRQFTATPGREYFTPAGEIARRLAASDGPVLQTASGRLVEELTKLHPIRYRELAHSLAGVVLEEMTPLRGLNDALRWVHFVDSIYDDGIWLAARTGAPLAELFPTEALEGPYGKKLSRCLSRLEELLSETRGQVRLPEWRQ